MSQNQSVSKALWISTIAHVSNWQFASNCSTSWS